MIETRYFQGRMGYPSPISQSVLFEAEWADGALNTPLTGSAFTFPFGGDATDYLAANGYLGATDAYPAVSALSLAVPANGYRLATTINKAGGFTYAMVGFGIDAASCASSGVSPTYSLDGWELLIEYSAKAPANLSFALYRRTGEAATVEFTGVTILAAVLPQVFPIDIIVRPYVTGVGAIEVYVNGSRIGMSTAAAPYLNNTGVLVYADGTEALGTVMVTTNLTPQAAG